MTSAKLIAGCAGPLPIDPHRQHDGSAATHTGRALVTHVPGAFLTARGDALV